MEIPHGVAIVLPDGNVKIHVVEDLKKRKIEEEEIQEISDDEEERQVFTQKPKKSKLEEPEDSETEETKDTESVASLIKESRQNTVPKKSRKIFKEWKAKFDKKYMKTFIECIFGFCGDKLDDLCDQVFKIFEEHYPGLKLLPFFLPSHMRDILQLNLKKKPEFSRSNPSPFDIDAESTAKYFGEYVEKHKSSEFLGMVHSVPGDYYTFHEENIPKKPTTVEAKHEAAIDCIAFNMLVLKHIVGNMHFFLFIILLQIIFICDELQQTSFELFEEELKKLSKNVRNSVPRLSWVIKNLFLLPGMVSKKYNKTSLENIGLGDHHFNFYTSEIWSVWEDSENHKSLGRALGSLANLLGHTEYNEIGDLTEEEEHQMKDFIPIFAPLDSQIINKTVSRLKNKHSEDSDDESDSSTYEDEDGYESQDFESNSEEEDDKGSESEY